MAERVNARSKPHDRLNRMESTLTSLLNGLKEGSLGHSTLQSPFVLTSSAQLSPALPSCVEDMSAARFRLIPYEATTDNSSPPNALSPTGTAQLSTPPIRSWAAAVELAQTFLLYCNAQPLPLFHPDNFVVTFPNRPFEVVYGVLAMAFRFIKKACEAPWDGSLPDAKECRQAAHQLAMSDVSTAHIELSTIQTLCLLAIIDLNDGNIVKCRVHGTLALTLARSAQLDRDPRGIQAMDQQIIDERRRCYWSIVLLHHLIGESVARPGPVLLQSSKLPFPASAASPPSVALRFEGQTTASCEAPTEENGICSIVIQLSEVWGMAQSYIRSRGGAANESGGCPPWHSSSKYSTTLELVMNLGDNLSPAHRYRFIDLSSVDSEELQHSRAYWAPWLLSRFLYHTTLCILNHPILIMLQIQGSRDVSEVFLQQTTFARIHHTSWLMHFIEFLDSRQFFISDPIIGYCAAVLATVELHQFFTEGKRTTAEKRKRNYEYCLGFIQKLSDTWPYMARVADNLQRLMETTSILYQSNLTNPNANKVSIDISGYFCILDLCEFCSGTTASPFGPTLTPRSLYSETQARSNLERLPLITEIDNQPMSSLSLTPVEAGPGSAKANRQDQHLCSQFDPFPADVDDDMLLQADQLFGPLYDLISPWDTVPGLSAANAGAGAEASYL
ncbi:hypothetical protein BDW72DRAFT_198634 [Aspergillus terricola var. indicus]